MTGRGRSRGRGRGNQPSAPGPPAAQTGGSVGRGRSRGNPPPQQAARPPPQQAARPPPQQASRPPPGSSAAAAPVEEMRRMEVKEERPQREGEQQQRRRRFEEFPVVGFRKEGERKQGTDGVKVNIVANYFQVTKLPKFQGLFQYNVSFFPEVQASKFKSWLVYQMEDVLGPTRCFDGMTLFLPIKLNDTITKRDIANREGVDTTVTVTFTNQVPENSPAVVQLMNILFRRQLKHLSMQLVGRHYFDPTKKIDIPAHGMEVWPGFETSILQHENDVMLCADVVHKVLNGQSVLQYLYGLYNQVNQNQFYDIAAKKLVGQIVLTRYNNKTYRIDDIDWQKHPTDTFEFKGKNIQFKEYYKEMYQQAPKDNKQPMLVTRPKEKDRKRGMSGPILLLPEFCCITGLSDEMRSNFTVMKDLAQHTRVGPPGRVQTLEKFMSSFHSNQQAKGELDRWNMEFSSKLLRMQGRTLPPQPMFQKKDKFSYQQKDADWQKETRGKELISAVNMNNWVLIYFQRDEKISGDFVQTLQRVGRPMGMEIRPPQKVKLPSDHAKAYSEALKANIRDDTEIVVCIVPNNRKDRYDVIKKLTCVDFPVPSQVVVSRTLSKQQMLMSVCTKIAIQLNCKLGGEVWATDIPAKKLMVVGFDVYHDSLNKGQSIGGFVASTNRTLTRYYSRITKQRSRTEISEQLRICMTGALKKYREVNGYDPSHVIVYRDGVGDGQLSDCVATEVSQMRQAIQEFNPEIVKFAMIIVKKRVSTRLFAQTQSGYSNPMPGTVVDSVVTRPQYYDFFLVSQSVRQGTVAPVHYNIINNTSGFAPDHFQKLTYKLCHLYYNWPGTIKVPAPCQYAHKLAFLIGQSVHTDPDPQLSDRLFYL